jgi:O-methyltransferase involved in polyketide biosynthesis
MGSRDTYHLSGGTSMPAHERLTVRRSIHLGRVQETALVPLLARALESRRKRPILEDPKAVEIVESIDWDFRRFAQRKRVVGCTLRSAFFDVLVRDFLRRHPDGTVVEIGTGLNTRFERLDNGSVHWYDLDLPDIVALRRDFFQDSERRTTLAASVLDPEWIETVRRSPPPHFLVAETVFVYLEEAQVKAALAQIAAGLPQVTIALDTVGRRAVEGANKDHLRRNLAARFAWVCEDPITIQDWNIGLHLLEARTVADIPDCLRYRLSWSLRAGLRLLGRLFPRQMKVYQISVFAGRQAEAR